MYALGTYPSVQMLHLVLHGVTQRLPSTPYALELGRPTCVHSCSTCSCAARSRRALCSAASAAALCWLSSWRARLLALASRQARCSFELASASESLSAASEVLEESRWDCNWYSCNKIKQVLDWHIGVLSIPLNPPHLLGALSDALDTCKMGVAC